MNLVFYVSSWTREVKPLVPFIGVIAVPCGTNFFQQYAERKPS